MQGTVEVTRAAGGTLRLAYDDVPAPGTESGPPVLLIHGFASRRRTNWISTGWYRALAEAGRRVIAFDHRGHGDTEISALPEDYDEGRLADDCTSVMAACGVAQADIIGYSMGAMVAIRLIQDQPERVRRAVLGGLGDNYLHVPPFNDAVAEALTTDDPSSISDATALTFRVFADQQEQNRFALAACWRRPRTPFDAAAMARIDMPVLVICGEKDGVTGSPQPLADSIPGARAVVVPGRDHMSAVGDRATKAAALAFLAE